ERAAESGRAERAATRPDLRVSDAERDVVAGELGEHFQAGRLSQDEFDERVSAALGARTRRDLGGLLADLPPREPGSLPGSPPGRPAAAGRPRWAGYLPLAVPLLFTALIVAGFAAHAGSHGPHHWGGPWPLLWLWWAIPAAAIWMRRRSARAADGDTERTSWR